MTPALPLALFLLYTAVLAFARGSGLVQAVASPPGWALLLAAAALLAVRAVRSLRQAGPPLRRAARTLVAAGGALALLGLPGTLLLRDARVLRVGEGQELPADALPGLPPLRLGEAAIAPRGPHLLSKTVAIEASAPGAPPVTVGLFPPASLGGWRLAVVRYGFAPEVSITGPGGARPLHELIPIGQLAPRPEHASLVAWSPEPNVMMGAGTYPPRLEDLLTLEGGLHVFLRLDAASIGGVRRDLRDPDAHRWLADGRPHDAVFFVQVFRDRAKVAEGTVPGGASLGFPGGTLTLGRDVAIWVELLGVRDPWLPVAGLGLALLAAGVLLGAGGVLARAARWITARAAAGRG